MSSPNEHDERSSSGALPGDAIPVEDPELVTAFRRQIASEYGRLEEALSAREGITTDERMTRIHEVAHRLRSSTAYLGLDELVRRASHALEMCESGGDAVAPAASLLSGIREYLATIDPR